MKKKLLTLGAFVLLTISGVFANGSDISKSAQEAFSASFSNASQVKWEKASNYLSAEFTMNGQSFTALYSTDGDMIAISHHVLSTELPALLKTSLTSDFSKY